MTHQVVLLPPPLLLCRRPCHLAQGHRVAAWPPVLSVSPDPCCIHHPSQSHQILFDPIILNFKPIFKQIKVCSEIYKPII